MDPLNPQPKTGKDNPQAVEALLQSLRQELVNLQQDVLTQLTQDIDQLRQEKAELVDQIEQLKATRQSLQEQQTVVLSKQQQAQQQLWAGQLAKILAEHLQNTIVDRLDQISSTHSELPGTKPGEDVQQLLTALDPSLSSSFQSLKQELDRSYNQMLQQISQMQNLEQQGEEILTNLERRLQSCVQPPVTPLQSDRVEVAPALAETTTLQQPVTDDPARLTDSAVQSTVLPSASNANWIKGLAANLNTFSQQPAPVNSVSQDTAARRSSHKLGRSIPSWSSLSPTQIGFLFAFLSTVAFSIHNVVVRLIGRESSILGLFRWGGAVSQLNLGNSLMTLWLRMIVVLPLMFVIARFIYPQFWKDIEWRFNARDRRERRPLVLAVISGLFLFFSQICIYVAIGRIGPGPAVTILFMYPLFTVLLSWLWLKKMRPTPTIWAVIGVIFLGVLLTVSPGGNLGSLDRWGISFAFFAGVFFALYMTWMDLSFEKLKALPPGLHPSYEGGDSRQDPEFDKLKKPILITLIQFTTVCLLSNLILLFPANLGIRIAKLNELIVGGVIIGSLALVAYLLNNFAVQKIGSESASITSSLGPVLTAVLAFLLIQDPLKPVQWFGVVLVTAGVIAFTVEKNTAKTRT